MTEKQKKFLNSADKRIRQAKKDLEIVKKEEESNSNKIRRQETVDSDEYTEVPES